MGFTNDFQKACRSIGKTKLFRGTTTTAVKKQQAHGDDYKKALAIDIFKQRRNGEKKHNDTPSNGISFHRQILSRYSTLYDREFDQRRCIH